MHALIAYEHGQFSQKRVVLARPFLIHRAEQGFAALYYIWHEYYGFGRDYRELSRWSLGDRGFPVSPPVGGGWFPYASIWVRRTPF